MRTALPTRCMSSGSPLARNGRWIAVALAVAACCLAHPDDALAHASERGHVLLLPTGYYILGGAAAVAASFLGLLVLPANTLDRLAALRLQLGHPPERLGIWTSLLGFGLFIMLVLAGFHGSRDPLSNPLPLTVWTLVWVGVTLLQGIVGDLWRWVDPWYAPVRLATRLFGGPFARLPVHFGYWPAVVGLAAFAWFELIYPAPEDPAILAIVVLVYWLATFALMLIFGHESWSRSGEFLTVFFRLISRFAIIGRGDRDGSLQICWPGARLSTAAEVPIGAVVFLLLALSSVSFDGLSKTFFWLGLNGINPLEFPGRTALVTVNTAGLALTFAGLATVFFAAVFIGERLVASVEPFHRAAGLLVWSIVPIALAYHLSHYLLALVVDGQYALFALSDPFAVGWNLLGTANFEVQAAIATGSDPAWVIWNVQAAIIILGHILAVVVAHGLAFRLHADARKAVTSQIPLTLLMIGYTVFGLWLLASPTAG